MTFMFSPLSVKEYIEKVRPSSLFLKNYDHGKIRNLIYEEGYEIESKIPLRDYQWAPLYVALKRKQFLLFLGPRLGKTKISLEYIQAIKKKVIRDGDKPPRFLIVVPSDEIVSVWESETPKHGHLKAVAAYGPTENRKKMLNQKGDLVIIPFSGLQAVGSVLKKDRKGKSKRFPDKGLLEKLSQKFDGVIIDEIHHCKSSKSLRYKILKELTDNKKYCLGLTGTPFGRDPYALWPQFFLVDRGRTLGSNQFFFEQAFSCPSENQFKTYEFDMRKKGMLSRKAAGGSYSLTTMEGLGISAIVHNTIRLKPNREQWERTRELADSSLGSEEPMNVYIKMRQIASGFIRLENGRDIPIGHSPKLGWLESELYETDQQVAIFYMFNWSGLQIASLMKDMKIPHVLIRGGQKDNTRLLRSYQTGKVKVAVIQCLIGSEGISLETSDRQIFFEVPDKSIVYQQSDFRAISPNRTKPLIVEDLVCSPVEENILSYLQEGKELAKSIIFNPAVLSKGLDQWTHR